MAKLVDAYAPCSCGSGEKMKFCCQKILADMDEVYEALSRDRTAAARTALERAKSRATGHKYSEAWVGTMLAVIDGREQGPTTALNDLKPILEKTPDFALAWIVASQQLLASERVDEAMGALEQALGHLKLIPSPLVPLLGELAIAMNHRREYLTSTCLATLAVSLSKEDVHDEVADLWNSALSEPRASLLVRTAPAVAIEAVGHPVGDKAVLAFKRGQMRQAARLFREVAESRNLADDWARVAIALCYAGLSRDAVPALRKAAELESDFERSVELEAIAQQLQRDLLLPRLKGPTRSFEVNDLAGLSNTFDGNPRCRRIPVPADDPQEMPVVSQWAILSGAAPEGGEVKSPADLPVVVARLSLFAVPEEGGQRFQLFAMGIPGAMDDAAFDEILSGVAAFVTPRDRVESEGLCQEVMAVTPERLLPESLRLSEQNELLRRSARQIAEEVWPNTPLAALDGKTPLEVRGDASQKRALAAAILVFLATPYVQNQFLDENELRERFGLPPVSEMVPSLSETAAMSLAEVRRYRLGDLSIEQLSQLQLRLMPYAVLTLTLRVAVEIASRPQDDSAQLNAQLMAGRLLHSLGRLSESLPYMQRAHALADSVGMPFESRIQFDLVELKIYAEAGRIDHARELTHAFWNKYAAKIPNARRALGAQFTQLVGDGPWSSSLELPQTAVSPETGSFTASGLWTPDAAPGGEPGKKLWIPGT